MNTHRPAPHPDERPGKTPARRKVLRVLKGTIKAPNIRGLDVSPKRNPEEHRRFREAAEKASKSPKHDAHALFSQFVDFMSKAMEQYGDVEKDKQDEGKKDAARIYTPCSDGASVPSIKADRPKYKPEITKGKLYFHCPACFYPTAVFAQYTGKKARCPRCFSAILTPDPTSGALGQNMENHIDAILHPEDFITELPKRTSISTVIPLPKITTALTSTAAVIFIIATIAAGRLAVQKYSPNIPIIASSSTSEARPQVSVPILHARAESLVQRFLDEPDWFSRSRLVRDRDRVAPLMKEYYRRPRPDDIPGQHQRIITAKSSGFYEHLNASTRYTKVQVEVPGSGLPPSEFIVEHTPMGDCIEWESSVAHNPMPLDQLLVRGVDTIQTLRVLATQDDYFNYAYNDDKKFICLRVQFPDDPETSVYTYLPANDLQAPKLLRHLRGATTEHPKPLMIDVQVPKNAVQSRQLEIVTVGDDNWRWEGSINPAFLAKGSMPLSPID